jgi:hypothetical protein
MKLSTGILAILLLGAAGAAGAAQFTAHGDDARRDDVQRRGDGDHSDRDGSMRTERNDPARTSVRSAPEISPGTLIAALTLLGGGLIVLRSRGTRHNGRA